MSNDTVRKALVALARAGIRSSPYLGHFGSAMLAGHFLCEELGLSPETIAAIRDCFPFLTVGEPADLFKNEEKGEEANPELVDQLREYILGHVGRLSRSGHVATIGMYALKGLKAEPSAVTPSCVSGIIQLLEAYSVERAEPRYYGYPLEYTAVNVKRARIQKYKSAKDALAFSISELHTLYPNTAIDNVYYYFVGEKLHGLTHAHALYEFECMGEKKIATQAYPTHQLQTILNRVKPPDREPVKGVSPLTPEHQEFWRLVPTFKHELGVSHTLKRSYTILRAQQAGIRGLGRATLQRLSYVLQRW